MFYYMEIDKSGNIISYGSTTSQERALEITTEKVCQINEQEYNVLFALRGKLSKGYGILDKLHKQAKEANEEW